MFTERPIYRWTYNKEEGFKFSLLKQLLENRRYKSDPRNANFDGLTFDGDEMLIDWWQIYRINDNILFR